MKLYFDDEGFDDQLQRTVGKCDAGMALGERLYIASRIAAGDRDSWYAVCLLFADRLVAEADAAQHAGHAASAASLRMRAAGAPAATAGMIGVFLAVIGLLGYTGYPCLD